MYIVIIIVTSKALMRAASHDFGLNLIFLLERGYIEKAFHTSLHRKAVNSILILTS